MLLVKGYTGGGAREGCLPLDSGERGEYSFRESTALTLATLPFFIRPFSLVVTDERKIQSERQMW